MHHFKPDEFVCKCGRCGGGQADMDSWLLSLLDEARETAGIPFVISSAYRCPAHNKAVGGVDGSSHCKGMAVDIRCVDSAARFSILRALFVAGLRRVELAPTWIHVDVDPDKPQDVAFYQKGGRY